MSGRNGGFGANLGGVAAAAVAALLLASASAQAQSAAPYHPSAAGFAAKQKGLEAVKRSDFTEARADFLAARESDPYWAENLYYLGLATAKLPGLELSAAAWFEAYLALEPKSPRAAEIRGTIDRLIQAGREHAGVVVTSMERMAAQFQPNETNAVKAHGAVLIDELALLEPAHPKGESVIAENGHYPQIPGDTGKAWAAAMWMREKGVSNEQFAREFAQWGRMELASRILDKGENGENWFDYMPELIRGHYLNEITAHSMFRPADILPAEKLPLETLCEASIAYGARQFAIIDSDNRREAMETLRLCAIAAMKTPDGEVSSSLHPLLADLVGFYLEDGNSNAAWQLYGKMRDPQYGELDPLARDVRELINATQAKWDGKPGAREQVEAANAEVDGHRHMLSAAAAMAADALPYGTDPYTAQKYEEEHKPWAIPARPAEFADHFADQHGPLLSPRQAADVWESEALNSLSGEWFEHYASQLEALKAHSSPNAIDKAGDLFSACADAAKVLLDALTEVTTHQRMIVIYRPPAVPLPFTWKKASDAAK